MFPARHAAQERTMRTASSLLAFITMLGLVACDRDKPAPTADVPKTNATGANATGARAPGAASGAKIDIEDPQSCKGCHANVYNEWTESMHSRAHHSKDPIYGSMRALRMKKQGEHIADKCAKCHNSRSPDAPDTPAGMAGVSCASCHNVAEVHIEPGKVGVDALTWEKPGVLRSSRDLEPGASPVHGTGPALPAMKDGVTLCLACHNNTTTPTGAPACTTGNEFRAADSDETCVSCHMPTVDGPAGAVGRQEQHASHAFLGPHRAWYQDDPAILEAAVEMTAVFEEREFVVSLKNSSAHSFPSGFPGRMALVKVVGSNAAGEQVFTNFEANAMAESPSSVLNKVYHDKEGKPAPAPFAEKLVRDTRLEPNATREMRYEVPAEVVRAKATLVYRLLPPPLAKKLGLSEAVEAEPRTVRSVEATR
jgi:hypothetical protein